MSPSAASPGALHWNEEDVRGFGMAVGGPGKVLRPTTTEQVADALADVRARGGNVALRGAGCSYGDAATNRGSYVLDLSAMNKILDFDPATGLATVEPGVTVRDLWRKAITFGYWPKVVSGTAAVSMGGAAAMNIHGKNNYALGPFGECVKSFDLMTARGELVHVTAESDPDLFHAAISGFGMLGCMTKLQIQTKRVHSGRLRVWGIVARDLAHNLQILEDLRGTADYLVSWVDLHAKGKGLGRGLMHRAEQLQPGEDPEGVRFYEPALQDVPTTMFGVVPKGWLWPGMWCALHLGQVGLVNALKFRAGHLEERGSPYLQTHGAFHFLLDYVPRWQWMTRPGGLIQFQPFVPMAESERVLRTIIERCQKAGHVPYLGVLKRHRPDAFLMTHAVDGVSMAMDFAVSRNEARRQELWKLCQELAEVVLEAGGRFYYAKDAVLLASSFARVHGDEAVGRFRALKAKWDPDRLLQTDLSRRMGV
ncbi:MAG: FAD-binding oxidoreductase [Planctomycetes bacterium]|nr:FAD-binding oxidoreductase [Planctomycetota bacterium]MCB9886771.1 FAD-binding oxidoreductase [Planctomycetota bacterium]